MKNIIIKLLLLFSFYSFSQSFNIKGKVLNLHKTPISFVNIILQSNDSSYIKGTTTNENGFFYFDKLKNDNYILKISYLGYEERFRKIVLDNDLILNSIILVESAENLSEIELTAKKPIIQQKTDRLVFNIENTLLSNKNTWDILKNTPSVFVMNDEILVRNSAIDIYINDKKIQLTSNELKSFLESTAGNNVKSIEVITNPSAKYDASGNAIINIVTKYNTSLGSKGSIYGDFTQGVFTKYTFGINRFYKNKKTAIFANYSFKPTKDLVTLDDTINFFDSNNEIASTWLSNLDITTNSLTHNLLFNLDYNINNKSTISLSTLNFFQPKNDTFNKTLGSIFNDNQLLDSTYIANSNSKKDNKNLSYALDFSRKLEKDGEKITTGISFNYYDNDDNQNIATSYFLPNDSFIRNNQFLVNTDQNIKIYTAQIDYTLPLTKSSKFETGTKISIIDSKSDFKQFNSETGIFILDTSKSTIFLYDETNYAFYSNYNKKLKKWYFQFGLRGEFTKIEGKSTTINEINKDDYFKLFPSLFLNYFPSEKHNLSFTYGKRINRPKYSQLNPFQSFFSDFAANIGNPNLQPAISHNLDFTYMLNKKYRFNLFYNNQKDKAEELSFQNNNTNLIEFVISNLEKRIVTGFDFYTNYSITKKWDITADYTLYYKKITFNTLESQNRQITNSLWRNVFRVTNNVTFLKNKSLNTSINFTYASPTITGSYKQNKRNFFGIDIQKELWEKKAVLTLNITDVFNTDNINIRSKYQDQDNGYLQKNETRTIKFGFRYNFGNTKLKENKIKKLIREKERFGE